MAAKKKSKGKKGDVKVRARAKTAGHGEPVLFTFIGDRDLGQHHVGIPARDLTVADFDALEDPLKVELLGSPIYHRNGEVEEVRTESDARKAKAQAHYAAESGKLKAMQPDPNVSGRTDADVWGPGLGVPRDDEPVSEGATGFQPADTSTTSTAEEG